METKRKLPPPRPKTAMVGQIYTSLPEEVLDVIDRHARMDMTDRAAVIRKMVIFGLESKGYWRRPVMTEPVR